jgi:hypothetical protein
MDALQMIQTLERSYCSPSTFLPRQTNRPLQPLLPCLHHPTLPPPYLYPTSTLLKPFVHVCLKQQQFPSSNRPHHRGQLSRSWSRAGAREEASFDASDRSGELNSLSLRLYPVNSLLQSELTTLTFCFCPLCEDRRLLLRLLANRHPSSCRRAR